MYYVFRSSFIELKAENDIARVEYMPKDFFPDITSGKPLAEPFPKLRFSIPPKTQLFDNHVTNTSWPLYSGKLINLLRNKGVKFKTFNAEIISRTTLEIISDDYHIFHLLEPFNALDPKKSILSKRKISKLVLSEDLINSQKLMVRPNLRRSLVLVQEELKNLLEQDAITGCSFEFFESFKL